MIKIKNHKSKKYCSDTCPHLHHSSFSGGYCKKYEEKLSDVDVDMQLVIYERTNNCLKSKRYEIAPQ